MICTECGATVLVGQQVIMGVEMAGGRWKFGFACSHKPAMGWGCVDRPAGVSVVLGSLVCVERWLYAYPAHRQAVVALMDAADAARKSASGFGAGLEPEISPVSQSVENRKN